MIQKILILTAIVFTFNACSLDDDNDKYSIETLPIKEAIVPDEFLFGALYDITITFELPSSCHSFYNLYYQYDANSRIVAINSLVRENTVCEDVVTEREFTFTVDVRQLEDYIFKFWKGTDNNGNDIFEEILVPVVQP